MILLLCLQTVIVSTKTTWEWVVLENIATTSRNDEESSLLLLSVFTDQSTIQSLTNRWQVGQSFVLPPEEQSVHGIRSSFQTLMQSQTQASLEKRDRFYSLADKCAQCLPHPDSRVALLAKLQSSRLFVDPLATNDDQKTLVEIEESITKAEDEMKSITKAEDERNQFWIGEISKLYGLGVQKCVNNAAAQLPEWKEGVMTKEVWLKLCAKHAVAQQASQFIKKLLSISNSGKHTTQRRMWVALEGIKDTAGGIFSYLDFADDSVLEKLASQESDARRICAVSSSMQFLCKQA